MRKVIAFCAVAKMIFALVTAAFYGTVKKVSGLFYLASVPLAILENQYHYTIAYSWFSRWSRSKSISLLCSLEQHVSPYCVRRGPRRTLPFSGQFSVNIYLARKVDENAVHSV